MGIFLCSLSIIEYSISFLNACGYGKWCMRDLPSNFFKDAAHVLLENGAAYVLPLLVKWMLDGSPSIMKAQPACAWFCTNMWAWSFRCSPLELLCIFYLKPCEWTVSFPPQGACWCLSIMMQPFCMVDRTSSVCVGKDSQWCCCISSNGQPVHEHGWSSSFNVWAALSSHLAAVVENKPHTIIYDIGLGWR